MLIYLSLIDVKDRSKFEQIYTEYRHLMFYVANNILKDEKLSEDAVHNAFLKLTNNLDKIGEVKCHKTKGFMVMIVRNISIDLYNNRKKENQISFDEIDFSIMDEQVNIEEDFIFENEHSYLVEKILSLPENYSNILYLKYIYELDDREISELLNITEVNVRKRLERARNALKSIVGREELIYG